MSEKEEEYTYIRALECFGEMFKETRRHYERFVTEENIPDRDARIEIKTELDGLMTKLTKVQRTLTYYAFCYRGDE